MQQVLLTGANGFLGKYINEALVLAGWQVSTLGRKNATVICNLALEEPVLKQSLNGVVHAAGMAHFLPQTPEEEKSFFDLNVEGTKRLCNALSELAVLPEFFVFISSVSVYGVEDGRNIAEDSELNGKSPYALSKIQAEAYLTKWCADNGVILSILRLPLVVGHNPPGNLGAMINAIKKNFYFNIGNGNARKSMVMASDVGKWIPVIAPIGGVYNLSDGYNPSFLELSALISKQLGKRLPLSIPQWLALPLAFGGSLMGNRSPLNTEKLRKISATLTFDDAKARKAFGWNPQRVLDSFKING